MKRIPIALAILLFTSCSTSTTEPTSEPTASTDIEKVASTPEVVVTASQKLHEILARHDADQKAFMDAYRQASSRAEKRKIAAEMNPDVSEVADELMAIVDESPDAPAAFDALSWVATNMRQGNMHDAAIDQLMENHFDREEMSSISTSLSRGLPSEKIEQRLRILIEKSPHREVRGRATFDLATYLARLPDLVEFADDPRMAESLGETGVSYLKNFVQSDERVEALYTTVANDYADIRGARGGTLGAEVEKALFALRHLGIGKVAPDIEGVDLDGEAFKLGEYRGNVVMLDFWGDW